MKIVYVQQFVGNALIENSFLFYKFYESRFC